MISSSSGDAGRLLLLDRGGHGREVVRDRGERLVCDEPLSDGDAARLAYRALEPAGPDVLDDEHGHGCPRPERPRDGLEVVPREAVRLALARRIGGRPVAVAVRLEPE